MYSDKDINKLKSLLRRAANHLETANEIILEDAFGDEGDYDDEKAFIEEIREFLDKDENA